MRIDGKAKYDGVLDIPEGKVNDYEVRHLVKQPGEPVPLGNLRTAFFRGQPAKQLKFKHETRWHELSYDGGVWMTDLPIEQWQHDRELARIRKGRVLMGGLGIGYAATVLALRPDVTEVVVVEKSPEVIQLVEAATRANLPPERQQALKVVQADLFAYLRGEQQDAHDRKRAGLPTAPTFDHGFYDIWQSDGETTFHSMVVPLLHLSKGVVRNRPINWNEMVMRGQLHLGLDRASRVAGLPEEQQKAFGVDLALLTEKRTGRGAVWSEWQRPFWEWVRDAKPEAARLSQGANLYASGYGDPKFERMWDRVLGRKGDYYKPALDAPKEDAA